MTGERWSRAAALAMALLLALGPLELRDGFGVFGLHVSVTELLAALAVATGLLAIRERQRVLLPDMAGDRWLRASFLGLCAWPAVHLLSALWAPADAAVSLKFGLRVLGGALLAFVAWSLCDLPRYRRALTAGLLVALAVVAALGVVERGFGRDAEFVFQQFRDEPTWMLGEQRLSTVFSHANTCAAFLELTAPLLVVRAAAVDVGPTRRALRLLWLAVVALLLSVTYSRAGLLAAVAGAVVLIVAARRSPRHPPLAWIAAGYVLLVVLAYAANPEMRARIGVGERSYRVAYEWRGNCVGHAGTTVTVPLHVRNKGEWPLSNRQAGGLLIHTWVTPRGKQLLRRWERTPLPEMPPGAEATVPLRAELPGKPGVWVLAVDTLRDEVLRVSALGNGMAWMQCAVAPAGANLNDWAHLSIDAPPDSTDEVTPGRRLELERRHYWRAALLLWERRPWLGWGADRFRLVHREYVAWEGYDDRARAHSVLAETAVDLGVVGVLALALLVVPLSVLAVRVLRLGGRAEPLALAAVAGLGGLAVHSQVDYFLAYTQLSVLIWPMVGVVVRAGAQGNATLGDAR